MFREKTSDPLIIVSGRLVTSVDRVEYSRKRAMWQMGRICASLQILCKMQQGQTDHCRLPLLIKGGIAPRLSIRARNKIKSERAYVVADKSATGKVPSTSATSNTSLSPR